MMSKELEALNLICDFVNLDEYDLSTHGIIEAKQILKKVIKENKDIEFRYSVIIERMEERIRQYDNQNATPPTEQEVCEALSEYLEREVKINNDKTFYYTEQRQIGECDEIICGYGWDHEYNTIGFELDLPSHLITMIGRFYESEAHK